MKVTSLFLDICYSSTPLLVPKICRSQGSPEKQNLWRLRNPTICCLKLEAQESQWSNPFQIRRPENQRSQWCISQSRVRRRWDERSQFKWWSRKKGANSSFLHLLFCLDPQQIGWSPFTLRKASNPMSPPAIKMLISGNSSHRCTHV